jgi:amidase
MKLADPTPSLSAASFVLEEATITSIHAAFKNKTLTCVELVKGYLERIDAYDRQGPALHAIITVNPQALSIAEELDRRYAEHGPVGALHGIPIILKDNYDTVDMPTSGGNLLMKTSQPLADAFTVDNMRKAGAVILAKANLQEFARGGSSMSSLGGQVINPYDLTRNPGGSSGGSGAAIAANFAVLGTGSDTGQSTRSPASANNLVGVRPTRGLVSRGGIMPNSSTQDEIGPIARTVKDAALLLDVMVGYDPNDPITAFGVGKPPRSYADCDPDALKGARIGFMLDMVGHEERHAEVNRVMEQVIETMQAQGATIERFSLPTYAMLSETISTSHFEAKQVLDAYLAALGPTAPVTSLKQIVDSKTALPEIQVVLEEQVAIDDGTNQLEYKDRVLSRDTLRLAVAVKMAELGLDAILYPLQKILVSKVGQPQTERNGNLSFGTGYPAINFPGGFSQPSADAPLGVPVGAELLGRDYSEPLLLSLAYAFEHATHLRKPPHSTPPL